MTTSTSELERVLDGAKLADTTRREYKRAVRAYVQFAGADSNGWSPSSVESWLASLLVEPITRNVYLAAIKRASRRWASLHRTWDFAAAVEGAVVPERKHPASPEPLDKDQLGALLGTCSRTNDPVDLRDRALLAVAIATGLRRRELAYMECADIDPKERSVVVIAKRGRRHRVRLSQQAWARVDAWFTWLRRRHIPTTGTSRVWRSLRRCLDAELTWCVGPSMTPEAVYRIVRRRAASAGLDGVTTHALRHSLIAALRDRGLSEEQIARRVGHASTATTSLYGRGRAREVVIDAGEDGLPA